MEKRNERGGAALEWLPVFSLLALCVSALLIGAYFTFARAWLQYQGEQSLYCLAGERPAFVCRQQLKDRLARVLPWGELVTVKLHRENETWKVELLWQCKNLKVSIRRRLSAADILGREALHW